jgi:TetR/AcrR family transcriptional repressor of mexCD-oprJ operon
MTTPSNHLLQEDSKLLVALASAMVEKPRATLQELAKAVGVSKATLYRSYRTREQLVDQLMSYSTALIKQVIDKAELDTALPLDALKLVIANTLEHREITVFLMHYWKDVSEDPSIQVVWDAKLDAFFLRGQQSGAFRIDINAAGLTELLTTILVGFVDAERRGRLAKAGLGALVEGAFLHGAIHQ